MATSANNDTATSSSSSGGADGRTTTVDRTTTMDHSTTIATSVGAPILPTQTPDDHPLVFPPPHVLDTLIDGQSYHLPSAGEPPVQILLLDGTFAKLFSDKVVVRGQTLAIPAGLSAAQDITSGGQTIRAQPGESKQPEGGSDGSSGGKSGGKGALGGFLKKLTGAAGKAAGTLAGAGKGAVDFAAGARGAAAATLAGTFSTAVGDVGAVVSSLNGIQKAFPTDQLTKAGMGAAMGALNLGRESSNWLTSMQSMAKGFDSLTPEVQQQARENMKQYAGPGGLLQKASEAMKAFEDFPWEEEIPTTSSPTASGESTMQSSKSPTRTSQSATATTHSSSQDTTTSSATPTATAAPLVEQYGIVSKGGTQRKVFDDFIKDLDGGVGSLDAWDDLGSYIYITNLTAAQAEDLNKKHDFLLPVRRHAIDEEYDGSQEEFRAIDTMDYTSLAQDGNLPRKHERLATTDISGSLVRRTLVSDSSAPWWKKMLSAPPRDISQPDSDPSHDPQYLTDDSGGKGTTVYVLDDGFDLSLPVSGVCQFCDRCLQCRISLLMAVPSIRHTLRISTPSLVFPQNGASLRA
jgi:hypothetical protein